MRLRRGGLLALALALLVYTGLPAQPPAAAAYPGSSVELIGHGYGHGRGLGQWGSLGYALDHDWSHEQILDHFYGGTSGADRGHDTPVTVQLTRFDGLDTLVRNDRGALQTSAAPGSFAALRARLVGPNTFQVDYASDCGAPWTLLAQVTGPVVFSPPVPGSEARADMVQACEPGGDRRWVRGEVLAVDGGGARTVNRLGMEEYLRGVVPQESPASWGTMEGGQGMAALRAQAVAARSYAEAENRSSFAKTCDTTTCQVYGGVAVETSTGITSVEQATTDAAIRETAGRIRRFSSGAVVRTEFSSSTGGWTAGGTFPAVPDAGDTRSPFHDWTASLNVSAVEAAYPSVGALESVDVTARNGHGDQGGRVVTVVVRGSSGSITQSGSQFRFKFGLRSDWFAVVGSGPPPKRLDVFARGQVQELRHLWFENNWRTWGSLGGVLTSDPGSVSWAPGRIDVFYRGGGDVLRHSWFDGRWHASESLGGTLTGGPDASSWSPGRLDVFARGTNNDLIHTWFDGRWHGWESLGGFLTSDPSAISWGPGRIDVFARGSANDLIHTWFDGRWHGWESLGGVISSGPDAASWAPGRLDVFARDGANGLAHRWFEGRWQAWGSLGGNLASDPSAVSWGPGRIDVFARGSANELRHLWFEGRWHFWESLGGSLTSGPDVASWN